MARTALLALTLFSSMALAQTNLPLPEEVANEEHWSVLTGRTVGGGENVLYGEVGWPGLGFSFLHGASNRFDVGGRFGFNYGSPVGVFVNPALIFSVLLKFGLVKKSMFSMGLLFSPSLGFGFGSFFGGNFGLAFPLGLELGLHPSEMVNIVFGFDFQPTIAILFAGPVLFLLPIMFGPGVEFMVDRHMAVTFNTRFGPGIAAGGGVGGVDLSFVVNFGFAYRL